ncbi:hypothetical protein KCU85_g9249, partial [Aureobasidium melanogenum]
MMAGRSRSKELRDLRVWTDDLFEQNSTLHRRCSELENISKTQLKEREDWKKLAEERSEIIAEQSNIIKKLEKRIAKMKGPEKIKGEVLMLEKRLQERKRELSLAEEDESSEAEDHTAQKAPCLAVETVNDSSNKDESRGPADML